MKKLAIVTGASSGIGRAVASKLASMGYNIVITGRREEKLKTLASEIMAANDIKVQCLSFDVRDNNQVKAAFAKIDSSLGQVAILVNNAGLAAGLEHINDGDIADWDAMIDTNIKGVLYVTKLIAPLMIAQNSGHIVNMGSVAGIQAYENGAVYCASKHAMHALSQGMRLDFLRHNIKVTEIRPGMVETEFSLIRFHGNKERADNVYKGVTPLTGDDIASTIAWVVSLPEHVNINDIEIMPTQQANAYTTYRKE